jgi:type III secretion protein L
MSYLLISGDEGAALVARGPVIRREEITPLLRGAEVLKTVGDRLQAVEEDRAVAREAGRQEGYAEGREAGLAAAAGEITQQLVRARQDLDGERAALRATAGELALEVVRRIAGEIGEPVVLAGLAERAVRDLVPAEQIRVLVRPEVVGTIAQRLWPMEAAIEVVGESTLEPGECVIDTPSGRTHAGLEVQLAALTRVFAEAVEDGPYDG